MYETVAIIEGSSFVKPCEAFKKLVPVTSNIIAKHKYTYGMISVVLKARLLSCPGLLIHSFYRDNNLPDFTTAKVTFFRLSGENGI
jgi:hypothetical protein